MLWFGNLDDFIKKERNVNDFVGILSKKFDGGISNHAYDVT